MLITGDITSFGETAGFEKAKEFLKDLNRILVRKLSAENIVICPGNHDLIRKEKELGKDVPEKVWESPDSIKAYKEFYYSISQPSAAIKPKKNHPIRRCTCYNAHIRYLVPNPSGTKFPCKHSYERMIL